MVLWLIGISGSNKTTFGKKIDQFYKKKGNLKTYIIDGDLVRNFYDNDLGYSAKDRKSNIKRIILAAYVLEQNGITPIVCNISPFEELREMARNKFDNYIEIFLNKDIDLAKKDDIKDIYKENLKKTSLVGVDIEFEYPKNYNLKIDVDKEDIDSSFKKIIEFLDGKKYECKL